MKNLFTSIFIAFCIASLILSPLVFLGKERKEENLFLKDASEIVKIIDIIIELEERGIKVCYLVQDRRGDTNLAMGVGRAILGILGNIYIPGECDYTLLETHGRLSLELEDTNDLLKGLTKDLPRDTTWFTSQCRGNPYTTERQRYYEIPYESQKSYRYTEEEDNIFFGVDKDFINWETNLSMINNIWLHTNNINIACISSHCNGKIDRDR